MDALEIAFPASPLFPELIERPLSPFPQNGQQIAVRQLRVEEPAPTPAPVFELIPKEGGRKESQPASREKEPTEEMYRYWELTATLNSEEEGLMRGLERMQRARMELRTLARRAFSKE